MSSINKTNIDNTNQDPLSSLRNTMDKNNINSSNNNNSHPNNVNLTKAATENYEKCNIFIYSLRLSTFNGKTNIFKL